MTIQKNSVVSIDYTLKNEEGNIIDSSVGHSPLTYMHGTGALIPGMENALEGKSEGADFKVIITPADGYGDYNENLLHTVDRKELAHLPNLEVGMELEVQADGEPMIMTIAEMSDDTIVLDGNHPLAGQTLNFDIQVREVREATADEISHGHAHGPGGHHH